MKRVLVVGVRGMPDVEGGIEKYAQRLFPLVVRQGWTVCVAGMKPFMETGDYRGVSLWCAPSIGIPGIDRKIYPIAALLKAFRMRPAIVHFASLQSAVLLWAYKMLGCKIVVRYGADCHDNAESAPARWARSVARHQLHWADQVIAVAPALARNLRTSANLSNVDVIGHALDRPEHYPDHGDPPVSGDYALFVGQISHKKNIENLIAAFRDFAKRHPDMQLVIVGDWRNKSARKNAGKIDDDRIVMLGSLPRSALAPLYRCARFFVNPSIREGHSNTLLEAISFDCPVLLSDLPQNRDLRLDAKHYFNPARIGSIASALGRAYANPDLFRVAKDRFPHWEQIAEQTIDIYEKKLALDVRQQSA